jgi:regulator of protease activity HflC (stomatin/prohibitin superfamily)
MELLPAGVCLQEIHPPLAVVGAFRDVSSAFKEKERLKNEAEGFYRDRVIKAAGEAVYQELSVSGAEVDDRLWERLEKQLAGEAASEINAARAFADSQQQLAAGDAESFALVQAAHAADPQITEWRMIIESLAKALPGKKKLILDSSGQGRRHLLMGLKQNLPDQLSPLLDSEYTRED